MRLDIYLVENQLVENRSKANALIMAGSVLVNNQPITKSGYALKKDDLVELKDKLPYVSRGGLKLKGALEHFGLEVAGRVALDIGASTGGFTDCLLQEGVSYVYAIDVGHHQFAYKLRADERVSVHEKVNFRHFTPNDFKQIKNTKQPLPDLAVIDVSFISLELILPPLLAILPMGSEIIALVKPQFEADREDVGKGGIVRDESVHQKVCNKVVNSSKKLGLEVKGLIDSPIQGKEGNKEFLIYLSK